jgi:hypothetical protein
MESKIRPTTSVEKMVANICVSPKTAARPAPGLKTVVLKRFEWEITPSLAVVPCDATGQHRFRIPGRDETMIQTADERMIWTWTSISAPTN